MDQQIRALLAEWDPIGVSQGLILGPDDEYDHYAPYFVRRLTEDLPRPTADEIFGSLLWIERHHMGLRGDLARTREIAARIAALGTS